MMIKTILDMFILNIPLLEKILRPLIIYIFLVVGLRLAGKRELASLNPLDLVVLLTISNTVQNAIIGDDTSVTGGIVGAATLLIANYVLVRIIYQNPRAEKVLIGSPEVLIDRGEVQSEALRHNLISKHDLSIAASKQGFSDLESIDHAEIEPYGAIYFARKSLEQEEDPVLRIIERLDKIEEALLEIRRR